MTEEEDILRMQRGVQDEKEQARKQKIAELEQNVASLVREREAMAAEKYMVDIPSGFSIQQDVISGKYQKDPWAHRSENMRCRTCMWYAPKAKSVGRCRRHAPTMNGYPVVYPVDWCGDHKLSEGR